MATNIDKYRLDLDALINLGDTMQADLQFRYMETQTKVSKEQKEAAKIFLNSFERDYQRWYTEASSVIRQVIPDRLSEFVYLYKGDGKRKDVNITSYTIQDWLNGVRSGVNRITEEKLFDDFAAVSMRFGTQLGILKAASRRFESSLLDIRQLVQADLLDSELEAASELAKHGFLRAAGAVAGVVLEKHLGQITSNRSILVRKKNPTISDLNDLLKENRVIDIPVWRQVQRLGDIRNLCNHNRDREPSSGEVEELIVGVSKISKTIY